jgi:acetate kinase
VTELVLALNSGSSSLKFGLFQVPAGDAAPELRARGVARPASGGEWRLIISRADGQMLADERPGEGGAAAAGAVLDWIESRFGGARLAAVGHRIVHGGTEFGDPVEIDEPVLARLEALSPLAPLHQPQSLAPVRLLGRKRPGLLQIACFDTAFHRTIAPPASRYALPRELEAQGIRRYGFHGLSYQSIATQLAAEMTEEEARASRVIVAHLGNGASLCAMLGLRSVDTTMGFSALDGLVMGTRPGSIDPGILLYLLGEKRLPLRRVEEILYHESGLLGVSGISSDVEALLASGAAAAGEAIDLFAFQAARHAAALAASLGGLDRFVFTGGIGEHSAAVREMIVERMQWLGARLDRQANLSGATRISSAGSAILVERRATDEERMIANEVVARIRASRPA